MPEYLYKLLTAKLNYDKVYEVRLRAGKPVTVNYAGRYYHACEGGVSQETAGAYLCDGRLVESVILNASNHSIYTVTNQLKEGYITVAGGIRLGICGEPVYGTDGEIRTFKNYSSVNIRIPHEVKNCALNALDFVFSGRVANTLVISPPGGGKTTFLRDMARLLSDRAGLNILVLDERGELAASAGGAAQLDVGLYTDVLCNCGKKFGFEQGIRTMRPDVIITDELANATDAEAIVYAASCGVRVLASVHAYDQYDYAAKPDFEAAFKRRLFERYVVLSARRGPGTYEGIYDAELNCLYYAK